MTIAAVVAGALVCVSGARADDVDGDGVDDAVDVCDNTPPGAEVDAEGRPLGDIDQDCDTDLIDFALFYLLAPGVGGYSHIQLGFTGSLAPPDVVVDVVTVGNPGNTGELSGLGAGSFGPDRICGAVDYVYQIGKYEVTAGQYTAFLNAVADEDSYGLYNTSMWLASRGCMIQRTGSPGGYSYSVAPDRADRPVNYVNWGDAARFANWLHNGQPTGPQNLATTEDGSYDLDGATSNAALQTIVREPDATWVIPSEDEWYKAAYYDGGSGVYYDYPTSTDAAPNNGNPKGDTGNSASFYDGNYTIGSPYWRTQVGFFGLSESPYGTFDQGGNVWEWDEAVPYAPHRGLRGGYFGSVGGDLHAALRTFGSPTQASAGIGFRIA